MPTDTMMLSEFADNLQQLADDWDDDEPVVLVGDVHGSLNISEKDGFASQQCSVGYASELFDGNGVHELSNGDARFFGTLLLSPEHLDEDVQEKVEEVDYEGVPR